MARAAASDAPVARVVDGPLGRWSFLEWRPRQLRAWVESLSLFEGRVELRRERTFPAAALDIILQLEGRYRPGDDPAADPYPVTTVNGVLPGPHVIEAPTSTVRVLTFRLHAEGASAVLGGAVPHITGVNTDLEDLIGREARDLVERCHALDNRAALLEAARFLERRLARTPDDEVIRWAGGRIRATAGRIAIAELARQTGLSGPAFARRFRARAGVSPKRLARVHRFRRVLEALHAGPGRSLSSLAFDAGYADQPHMNAEFRELAGLSPTRYLAARQFPGSPSLVEAC